MKDYKINDEFLDKLPEISFAKKLSEPVHKETPARWNEKPPRKGEIFVKKLCFGTLFNDPDGVLETAWADFREFMKIAKIEEAPDGIKLSVEVKKQECFEAYTIKVCEDSIVIYANDTEAVRRALIYIEDEMKRRSGTYLEVGTVKRKPFIKNRISRCYFTPSSHAAVEETKNELLDDTDYYPDEYLNRLAHDGINALWLGASLRYLVKSDLVPEYGTDSEKRLKKLNEVIAKCKRYGIKIFLFAVDPASSYHNPHLLKHPEMMNDANTWIRVLCPSSDAGYKYLTEAVKTLFRSAPGLAGYINLSVGESLSTCASFESTDFCRRCKARFGNAAKTLAFVEKTIADAMHEVNPELEYISWTYAQRSWKLDSIKEACEARDKDVIHLQNFEDYGRPVQLGKKRYAIDYWLSYPGPGDLFRETIKINEKRGIRTYAKIQVCSSHEISTVPYVTAPGILYDKYKYFLEHNIDGVMQCWFFGNYPGLMNKAAGELSFLPFPLTKDEFLEKLASIYWGDDAKKIARAWAKFEEAYKNYPVNVAFEWLGPMQDSPAVPLHLIPADRPMPSTWLVDNMVGGDRLGECMLDGHTHEEALELVRLMCEGWDKGLALISDVPSLGKEERQEQIYVNDATGLIFRSGYNILRFYQKRRLLGIEKGDTRKILDEMEEIVKEEMEISRQLIPICENDNRIGYHSEAHGHKIFPEKLKWRIGELEKLLKEDFPEVRARIENGLPPLAFYRGEIDGAFRYFIGRDEWSYLKTRDGSNGNTRFRIIEDKDGYTVEFETRGAPCGDIISIKPEFRMFHASAPIQLSEKGTRVLFGSIIPPENHASEIEKFNFKKERHDDVLMHSFYISRKRYGMEKYEPFRLNIEKYPEGADPYSGSPNAKEALVFSDKGYKRLIAGNIYPECYGFFIPKK